MIKIFIGLAPVWGWVGWTSNLSQGVTSPAKLVKTELFLFFRYRVWDSFGRQLYNSGQHDYPVTSVSWSSDGQVILGGIHKWGHSNIRNFWPPSSLILFLKFWHMPLQNIISPYFVCVTIGACTYLYPLYLSFLWVCDVIKGSPLKENWYKSFLNYGQNHTTMWSPWSWT